MALALSAVRSADRVALAAGLGLVPFVILGWLNATLFARYAAHSALLYGADLLGAALGLGAALLLVEQAGALGSVLALAAVAGLAAALLAWESRRALRAGPGCWSRSASGWRRRARSITTRPGCETPRPTRP